MCPAEETFCRLTIDTDGLFTVEDARRDPRFADIGFVDGRLARARFYASAPIHDPAGSKWWRAMQSSPTSPGS